MPSSLKALAMAASPWISVDEALPDNARLCLVAHRMGPVLKRSLAQLYQGKWGYAGSDAQCRDVEYWMEVPMPPKAALSSPAFPTED